LQDSLEGISYSTSISNSKVHKEQKAVDCSIANPETAVVANENKRILDILGIISNHRINEDNDNAQDGCHN